MAHADRSPVLPTDPFDIMLSTLMGLPNGAHTAQHTIQSIDPYGNSTTYIVQTVRTDEGQHAFVIIVDGTGQPPKRIVLPPKVLTLIDRQRDTNSTQVRRRHGRRIAEERGNPFTPEMRRKALETRKRNARKRGQR